MMAKAKNDCTVRIKEKISDCRTYWKKAGEADRIDCESRLRQNLDNFDYRAVKVLPVALNQLAIYHGSKGFVKVSDDNIEGWASIDRAVRYRYWQAKLAIAVALMQTRDDYPEQFNPAKTLLFEPPIIASLLNYAIVHDLEKLRNEMWRAFEKALVTPNVVRDTYWSEVAEGKYEIFVYRLLAPGPFGEGAGLPEHLKHRPLGSYAHLFDAWEDAAALAQPLREVCEYRCQNMVVEQAGKVLPFEAEPFSLVPYEILAIYKLRERQGLETPEIDHPLMKLSTASRVPRQVHAISDPAFAEIEALFNKHCQPFWNETLEL